MKKIMLLVALMVATVGAKAQAEVGTVTLKPTVGMTLANVTDAENNSMKVGLIAGVEAEYQVIPMLGISVGALYSMQGCSYDDLMVNGTGLKDNKTELDYLNIPILANVYVAKGLAIKAGIQPAFCLSAKDKYTAVANGAEVKVEEDLDEKKSFDFSIPVGLSYEYSDFVLDARYNFGLTKVADGTDSKNSVFQITLGYKFAL